MRKLNTGDVFKMFRIIKNADLKAEVQALAEQGRAEQDTTRIGVHVALALIEAMGNEKTESDVCTFISDVAGMTPQALKEQPIQDTLDILIEIAKLNNLKNFFGTAAILMKN